MKKILFLTFFFMLTSAPAFAQKLGSSSNPNPTGSAGAFAVYTPEEIETDDAAGQDVMADDSMPTAQNRRSQMRRHRRPNYWVLSGGEVSKTTEELAAEENAPVPEPSSDGKKKENKKAKAPAELSVAEETTAAASDATSASDDTDISDTDISSETETAVEEDTLVCRKYEKCSICPKYKPYWSGRECIDKRVVVKMKRKEKAGSSASAGAAVPVNSAVSSGTTGQGATAVSGKKSKKSASKASSKSGKSKSADSNSSAASKVTATTATAATASAVGAASQEDDENAISVLNPDGTPKSKRQILKEMEKAQKEALKKKKNKTK